MKINVDTDQKQIILDDGKRPRVLDLYGKEAFEVISDLWVKTSWNQKYSYTFTWMGRPIIQHPEDMVRLQEVICCLKPDVIVETGVAHGGSLIFYASLFKAMGMGRKVVGVDVEIHPRNRACIERHELAHWVALIEGDSIAPTTVDRVASEIRPNETVLVLLDSNHSKAHVAAELEAYHRFVTKGSYIVATDGIMRDLYDVPRGQANWRYDNPAAAAEDFVGRHSEFVIDPPRWKFNESSLDKAITLWPSAWLRRVS